MYNSNGIKDSDDYHAYRHFEKNGGGKSCGGSCLTRILEVVFFIIIFLYILKFIF